MSDDLSIPNPSYRGNQAGRYGTGQNRSRPGMDLDTRRLLMFAAALGAVLLALIGVSTLIGHHAGSEVPVIAADPRPIRVKPENPGGMKIDGAENDVFSGGTDTANSRMAPASENPNSIALRPKTALPAPVTAPPTAVAVTPTPPADAPRQVVAVAATKPPPIKPAAAPAPAIAPTALADPAKPQASAPADAHPLAPGHQAVAQLAALTSEDAAHNEWLLLSKRMPDVLNGRQPVYSRADRDGHTYWRVRTTGFADITEARAFCDRVRAKGGGCSVTEF